MSLLILAVGWAYTQICRIYPDGGGVYTAAKQQQPHPRRHRRPAALRRLHRHRQPQRARRLPLLRPRAHAPTRRSATAAPRPLGRRRPPRPAPRVRRQRRRASSRLGLPGLWAIVAIVVIGLFNLMGPKHTGGFAIVAAVGHGAHHAADHRLRAAAGPLGRPARTASATSATRPRSCGSRFVSIVLALSGVEAIANLTGVMKKPVARTARKAIWVVAIEVAVFNVLLAARAWSPSSRLDRDAHIRTTCSRSSAGHYVGHVGRVGRPHHRRRCCCSRPTNTAITDMISVQYLHGPRRRAAAALPEAQPLRRPVGRRGRRRRACPCLVLLISHDLEQPRRPLRDRRHRRRRHQRHRSCSVHPRLRRLWRKVPMARARASCCWRSG